MREDPYCSNCGYSLTGATESARCPECGKPLVEVLTRDTPASRWGRRYQSETRLFGLPLVSIAQGPHGNERFGVARGIFAVGDIAVGWFAVGGLSAGLVSVGGLSLGLVALGGQAIALLVGLGGLGIGGMAAGGGAAGIVATGGGAVGYVAQGGGAYGHYVRAGDGEGTYVIDRMRKDAEAVQFFQDWSWLLGRNTGQSYLAIIWTVLFGMGIAVVLGLIVWLAYAARQRSEVELR